ncbi:MAG: hypothetical protein V1753_05660 [Pseudomonadota bacterium]
MNKIVVIRPQGGEGSQVLMKFVSCLAKLEQDSRPPRGGVD